MDLIKMVLYIHHVLFKVLMLYYKIDYYYNIQIIYNRIFWSQINNNQIYFSSFFLLHNFII